MEIRKAETSDFEAYCQILNEIDALHAKHEAEYFRFPAVPARNRQFFDEWLNAPEKELLLAIENGECTGLIHLERRNTPDLGFLIGNEYGHVGTLMVAEKWQQRGVGSALIEKAELWAKAHQLQELRLNVWSFNQDAIHFYESQGFRPSMQTMIKRFKTNAD